MLHGNKSAAQRHLLPKEKAIYSHNNGGGRQSREVRDTNCLRYRSSQGLSVDRAGLDPTLTDVREHVLSPTRNRRRLQRQPQQVWLCLCLLRHSRKQLVMLSPLAATRAWRCSPSRKCSDRPSIMHDASARSGQADGRRKPAAWCLDEDQLCAGLLPEAL